MLTDQSSQTDVQEIGLTAEEEALRTRQMHKDQDRLSEEYEEQYRSLLEKTELLESSLHSASRVITQLKLDNGILEEARARQETRIYELEHTLSQRLARVATPKDDDILHTVIEEQEQLFATIESQKRQIAELSRVNHQTADSLSVEIGRLTLCLDSSLADSQRLTLQNKELQQQVTDLKDQFARDNSGAQSPFTPWMSAPTLAAEFWLQDNEQRLGTSLMSTNPLFTDSLNSKLAEAHEPSAPRKIAYREPFASFQDVDLGQPVMLTNALFIARQKNKLLADALQDHPRSATQSVSGGWINKANRDHILTLLDGLEGFAEDLHALPLVNFMKVIHDVETTIQYGRSHQEAYALSAPPCDRSLFFSHNKAGVKNAIKVTDTWERGLRAALNRCVTDCLINSSIARGLAHV